MGFFTSAKKITFIPYSQPIADVDASPVPANKVIPEWYKKLPRYVNDSDIPIKSLGMKDLKMCVPFRDAMISGYLLTTPIDIEVKIDSTGNPEMFWNQESVIQPIHKRGLISSINTQGHGMPVPAGMNETLFAWNAMWGIETDLLYSVLVTHPLNRYDLPFITTSGIIDSGFLSLAGNIPFFIKNNFEGIIEKGTPIAQVLPFKREDWTSEILEPQPKKYQKVIAQRDSYLGSFYSSFLRQPRKYT